MSTILRNRAVHGLLATAAILLPAGAMAQSGKPPPAPPAAADDMNAGLAELLTPLVPDEPKPTPKPKVVRPGAEPLEIDVDAYERTLAEAERERRRRDAERAAKKAGPRTIIVERSYVDPCGDFTFTFAGEKRCKPMKRTKHELVAVDDGGLPDPPGDDRPAMAPPPSAPGGRPGPSASPGAPPKAAPGAPPSTGPGNPGAPLPADSPGGGAGPAAGAPGSGTVARMPDANGFADAGPYTIRVDRTTSLPTGDIDVDVTFATRTAAKRLIGNGDWRILATDEDGVSIDTTAIYRAGTGAPAPFDTMPYVSAATPAKARFRIIMGPGMSTIRSISAVFTGAPAATFPITPLGPSTGTVEPTSTATPRALKWFEVRYDAVKTVGRTTELFFSARNRTDALQYTAGTRLVFIGTGADGKPVENSGRIYPVRGPLARPYEGVSVLPGTTGRFRAVFDSPSVRGPITVKDGVTSASPPLPAAAEPVW